MLLLSRIMLNRSSHARSLSLRVAALAALALVATRAEAGHQTSASQITIPQVFSGSTDSRSSAGDRIELSLNSLDVEKALQSDSVAGRFAADSAMTGADVQ